jgi:hypothetical protein
LQFSFSSGQNEDDVKLVSLSGAHLLSGLTTDDPARKSRAQQGSGKHPGLRELLAAEGLGAEEVSEVLDLIEWKKARRKQSLEEE